MTYKNGLKILLLSFIIMSCNNSSMQSKSTDVPFIGIRHFETRAGVSGTGTPHYTVEIKENKDVIFRFEQINQGDKSLVTTDSFYAGKFSKYIYCKLDWDDFPRYYEITQKYIYEVDSNHKKLSLPECCIDGSNNPCPCFGELYELSR